MRAMHRLLVAILISLAAALASTGAGGGPAAEANPAPPNGSGSASVVCTPRQSARTPGLCADLPGGLPGRGLPHRAGPLPTVSLDISYSYVPFRYKRLSNSSPTPLYTSAEDARAGRNAFREIEPGFNFVSWLDCQILDGKAIYQIAPGVFMRGGGDCSQIGTSTFKGLQFYRTPQSAFGWVLGGTYSSPEPGAPASQTTTWHNYYDVVRIYESVELDGLTWYRVGDGEWLEQRSLAIVEPNPTPPEGVAGDRWISINLFEQTLSVYEEGQLIFATLVSTGLPGWWTQPGTFQVYERLEQDDMSGSFEADRSDYYFLQDVPWVLYFDQARALHGAYWHNGYGYQRSHGCVNLSPSDARWLYDWAGEGTWVNVYDPSGQTPTDAELYTEGGA